jgi:single-strand DNA-binding protein
MLTKGKLVQIEGKISYRQYTNAQNQKVNVTEIVAFKIEEFKPEKK